MSEEQLKAFLAKVKGDESLQEQLRAATSPAVVVSIAEKAGFCLLIEDINSDMIISDYELETATGGMACTALRPISCQPVKDPNDVSWSGFGRTPWRKWLCSG